jgi:putative hydrolase of the HAD superfamily
MAARALCLQRVVQNLQARVAVLEAQVTALSGQAVIDTLVFDIDDTLYQYSTGFTKHRVGPAVEEFMVETLGFKTAEEARALRALYYAQTHSTLKALIVADAEGALPEGHRFVEDSLGAWWATRCAFELLAPQPEFIAAMRDLPVGVKKVVFTNAPRQYGVAVLRALGLLKPQGGGGDSTEWWCFEECNVFAVEDVLPQCKPEPAAFCKVLESAGSAPERSVMLEDSLKNVRAAKALGMHTVFVRGAEAAQQEHASVIDVALESVSELRRVAPQIWNGRF